MSWSEQFFTRRRLTSKLKHLVLERYVKEFAYHLGSARPIVYYIDGFAGAGLYIHENVREEGSPLLIAQLAEQVRGSARPFELKCLNVESNRGRFSSLDMATRPYQPHIVEQNYNASFVDVIPDILQRVGHAPAFFFIDLFGTKDVPFTALHPIFNRTHRTEVLITLQTDGIAKKAGWFRREDSTDPSEKELAQKFVGHLAAALDIPTEKLREGWRATAAKGETSVFEERAVQYYLRKLQSKQTRFNFAKQFRVLYRDPNDPFRVTPVCFHLVFATQDVKGLFEMNDAMADAVDAFHREIYSGTLFPQFVAEVEHDTGRHAVRAAMRQKFGHEPFTINDIKRFCMQHTDCLLKGGEYRRLILQMAKPGGELERLDSGGTPTNERTLYRFAR